MNTVLLDFFPDAEPAPRHAIGRPAIRTYLVPKMRSPASPRPGTM